MKLLFCLFLFTLCSVSYGSNITLYIKSINTSSAFEALFKSQCINYSISSDVTGFVGNLSLSDVSLSTALKAISKASSQKITWKIQDNVYFVSAYVERVVAPEVIKVEETEEVYLPELILEKIPLLHTNAADTLDFLNNKTTTTANSMFSSNFQNNNHNNGNYGNQNYGNQNYGNQNYGNQTFGNTQFLNMQGNNAQY